MEFRITQTFDHPREVIVDAFRRERTWNGFRGLPFVGDATVRDFAAGDPTYIAAHYQVSVNMTPAARRFIDPAKLTFVEVSHLAADGTGRFEILPDHYGDLIRSSGTTHVTETGATSCTRTVAGLVEVRLGVTGMLFERPVEEGIVRGLRQALLAQARQVRTG